MKHLTRDYYSANATYLSPEALEEIRQSRGKVKCAGTTMARKHHIATRRVYEIWNNHVTEQPNRAQQEIASSHHSTTVDGGETKVKKSRSRSVNVNQNTSIENPLLPTQEKHFLQKTHKKQLKIIQRKKRADVILMC